VWYTDEVGTAVPYYRAALIPITDLTPSAEGVVCPCCPGETAETAIDFVASSSEVTGIDSLTLRGRLSKDDLDDFCRWHIQSKFSDGNPYYSIKLVNFPDPISGGSWLECRHCIVYDSGNIWFGQGTGQLHSPDWDCSPFSGHIEIPVQEIFTSATGTISLDW